MLSFVRPDAHKDFATEAKKRLEEVKKDIANRHPDPFKNRELWREGRHKNALAGVGAVWAKCAWCERIRDISHELDVEHYRPKGAVTCWTGAPSLVSDDPPKEVYIGPGYWWLAFTWEYYSLACKACNQRWKRNLFPVEEPRPPCVEGVEKTERPLLLDPSMPFRVSDHFSWSEEGYMDGISPQGRATIITCGLNRKPLVAERAKLAVDVLGILNEIQIGTDQDIPALIHRGLGQLALLGARTSEFAGMVRWFTEHFFNHRCRWEEIEGLPE